MRSLAAQSAAPCSARRLVTTRCLMQPSSHVQALAQASLPWHSIPLLSPAPLAASSCCSSSRRRHGTARRHQHADTLPPACATHHDSPEAFSDEYRDKLHQLAGLMTDETVQQMRSTLQGPDLADFEQLLDDIATVTGVWHPIPSFHDADAADADTPSSQDSTVLASSSHPQSQTVSTQQSFTPWHPSQAEGLSPPTDQPPPKDLYSYLRQYVILGATDEQFEDTLDTMGRDTLDSIARLYEELMQFAQEGEATTEEQVTAKYQALSHKMNVLLLEIQAQMTDEDTATAMGASATQAAMSSIQHAVSSPSSPGGVTQVQQQAGEAGDSVPDASSSSAGERGRAWGDGWGRGRQTARRQRYTQQQHTFEPQQLSRLEGADSGDHSEAGTEAQGQLQVEAQGAEHAVEGAGERRHWAAAAAVAAATASSHNQPQPVHQPQPQPHSAAASQRSAGSANDWLVRRPVDLASSSTWAWASSRRAGSSTSTSSQLGQPADAGVNPVASDQPVNSDAAGSSSHRQPRRPSGRQPLFVMPGATQRGRTPAKVAARRDPESSSTS